MLASESGALLLAHSYRAEPFPAALGALCIFREVINALVDIEAHKDGLLLFSLTIEKIRRRIKDNLRPTVLVWNRPSDVIRVDQHPAYQSVSIA